MSADPFARQKLLPEVGEAGQARLTRAAVLLPVGPGSDRAADYLRRAGVGSVRAAQGAQRVEFPHAGHFRHAASADVGAGAWQALQCLRALLTEPPGH